MRTIAATFATLVVILVSSAPAFADRATSIAQDLQLPPDVSARIASSIASYDADLYRLKSERAELRRQMISPHTDSMSQKLLDDVIANAHALVQLDEGLVATLRAQLPPDQILRVFVMLNASEPEPSMIPPPKQAVATHASSQCNPFDQPHGCPSVATPH